MKVELNLPESATGPHIWAPHPPEHEGPHIHPAGHADLFLTMALQPGSIEIGWQASEMKRVEYQAYEVALCPPYVEQSVGSCDFERLHLGISDPGDRLVAAKWQYAGSNCRQSSSPVLGRSTSCLRTACGTFL